MDSIAAVRTRDDLKAYFVKAQLGGVVALGLGGTTDPDNAKLMIAGVGAGGLSLPDRDYYIRQDAASVKVRSEFLKHVQIQLRSLGDSPADAEVAARAILELETSRASSMLTSAALRDPANRVHKMNFDQLQALAPAYDWKSVFEILNVPVSTVINVVQPEFVKETNRELTEVPVETWKTWLRWRTIEGAATYLPKTFADEQFRFDQTVLSGVEQQLPRWKTCVADADAVFGDTLGRLYAEKYFPEKAQRAMGDLVENMRSAFADTLESADWLAAETRKNALRKLTAFEARIGFPPDLRTYDDVVVSRDGYLNSTLSASLSQRRHTLSLIGKEPERRWGMTPPTVNAQYSPSQNAITFPAGILQFPFFDMDADPAVNYGAIGAVIGHEMGHGFDDSGSKFDADGNVKNWWTDADRATFDQRAACVTNQFDSIEVGEGLRHNGKLVTGEAMGDLGGLTLAYKAYHLSLKGKEAPVIDGYTGDQRFFLAFARVWAGAYRPEALRRQLATNEHPLGKFRTDATLQNMPEFQAAFQCKLGDAMVRPAAQQCRLW